MRKLLTLLCGGLIPLAFAPFNFLPALLVGCIGIFVLLKNISAREAAFYGWLFGIGFFGVGASWVYVSIHVYGPTPVPLALLLTGLFICVLALFFSLQFFCYQRWLGHHPLVNSLGFATIWVLFEWLRSWIFTGFPWLYLGYGALDTSLQNWAPVLGVYGVSFCLLISALWFYQALRTKKIILFSIALAPWILGFGLGFVSWTERQTTQTVAMIQGNIPQSVKWEPEYLKLSVSTYTELTENLWQRADLIIWPESALPILQKDIKPLLDDLSERAIETQTTLLMGIPFFESDPTNPSNYHIYNSVLMLGENQGLYHKQHLVPFGEYVPFESFLRGLISFFDLPMSDFSSGEKDQPLLRLGDYAIAPFICYEIAYPDFVAKQSVESNLLLTVSNDTWFGASIGPHQHFQIARMRALENAKYLLRATNNGITAIVDQKGRVTAEIPQFITAVLTGKFEWRTGKTWYASTGSLPILLLCLFVVFLVMWQQRLLSKSIANRE